MKTRFGVIGAGNISKFHIEAFSSLGAEIAAIAATPKSLNAEHIATKYGIPIVLEKWQDITNERLNIDGIIVCTPPSVTPKILSQISHSGKPILVEKPISYDPEFLKELKHATSSPVYVAYNRRFYESVIEIKNLVNPNEVFFNATIIEASYMNSLKALEEIICGNSVHILDLCLHIFGKLKIVDLQVLNNNLGITAKFNSISGKYVGTLQILFGIPKNSSIEIFGDNFRCNLTPIESLELFDSFKILEPTDNESIRRYIPVWSKTTPSFISSSSEFKPGFLSQAKAFIQVCSGEESPLLCNLDEAIQTLDIAKEIYNCASKSRDICNSNEANA